MLERPDIVLKMLLAKTNSLIELARLSELEPISFYQGADLTGLDLTEQDLRGLNFKNADLRHTRLENIAFDPGAFNGSLVEPEYEGFQDLYEYFIDEIIAFPNQEVLAFVRFRPGFVDTVISWNFRTISSFASEAKVGINTLRKARQGGVVAVETAQSILSAFTRQPTLFTGGEEANILRQPAAMLLSGGNNATFNPLSRARLQRVLDLRKEYVLKNKMENGSESERWRDTPEMLELFAEFDNR